MFKQYTYYTIQNCCKNNGDWNVINLNQSKLVVYPGANKKFLSYAIS